MAGESKANRSRGVEVPVACLDFDIHVQTPHAMCKTLSFSLIFECKETNEVSSLTCVLLVP